MIKLAKEKLHSQKGVSILFAMLFFLLASVLAVTILESSVTASKRVANDRIQTQNYLALRSAAQTFADELSESKVRLVYSETLVNDIVTETSSKTVGEIRTGDGNLGTMLHEAFVSAYGGSAYKNTLNVVVSYSGSTDDLEAAKDALATPVTVDFTMTPAADPTDIKITATFTIYDGDVNIKEQNIYMSAPHASKLDSTGSDWEETLADVEDPDNPGNMLSSKRIYYSIEYKWDTFNFSSMKI